MADPKSQSSRKLASFFAIKAYAMNNQESLSQKFLQLLMAAIIAIPLVFGSSWVLQKFFATPIEQESLRAGQSLKILPTTIASKPLNFAIDFVDNDLAKEQTTTSIAAPPVDYQISTGGASITQIDYMHTINGGSEKLNFLTIQPQDLEGRALLVALDIATPYAYTVTEKSLDQASPKIVYKAESEQATIIKEFIFDQTSPKVVCNLTITPKVEHLQPRIFLPGPYLTDLSYNEVRALILNEQQELKKIQLKETENTAWVMPGLVGTENRYFINALIADPQSFTQRAYFMRHGNEGLTTILEGPEITTTTTWQLSFYIGPKIHSLIMSVDPRLEDTLEFGIFAPISRFLLGLLNWVYQYVHNYGWAIILLTAALSILLIPLSVGTQKPGMSSDEFNRKMRYIEQKYKDDKETLRKERLALVEKNTPALPSFRGLVSMIVNFAAGISLYRVLGSAIELYHAPFLWIPDLSAKDPYYILATILGFSIFIAFAGKSKDPRQWVFMAIIAAFIGWFMGNFAAGLMLYILVQVIVNASLKPYIERIAGF